MATTLCRTRNERGLCEHCKADIKGPHAFRPNGWALDSGGDCPTCKQALCRSCAGGWCSDPAPARDEVGA